MQFWIKKHDFQKYTFVKDNKRARQSLFSMNIHMSRSGCILIGVLMHSKICIAYNIKPELHYIPCILPICLYLFSLFKSENGTDSMFIKGYSQTFSRIFIKLILKTKTAEL